MFPELIDEHVLTQTKNKAGIYGFKFFIRGIPWVVSIDDNLLYTNKAKPKLVFAKEVSGAMWGPLFEKTWAKVKGNYASSEAGFVQTMLSTFTGAPIFYYDGVNIIDEEHASKLWNILKAGYDSNYIMGGTTTGAGDDTEENSCGMAMSHAFSILAAFKVTELNGKETKLLLVRNPWGFQDYVGDWNATDPRWTPYTRSQVPKGVDITTSDKMGVFALPASKLINGECLNEVSVVHYRDHEGYKDSRYDAINTDNELHDYTLHVPE